MLNMRTDSCRKCGDELESNKKCQVCSESNQFVCHKCGEVTGEQIHSTCIVIDIARSIAS